MRIRQASEADLEAIVSVQNMTSQAARWTQADYASWVGDPAALILVAELDTATPPTIVGFAAFRRLLDEAELRNMAVDPAYQRRSVGRELLAQGRKRLAEQGVRRIYLEVRPSNLPALRLYYSEGFRLHSRRKDYYNDPPEDALVLSLGSSLRS